MKEVLWLPRGVLRGAPLDTSKNVSKTVFALVSNRALILKVLYVLKYPRVTRFWNKSCPNFSNFAQKVAATIFT